MATASASPVILRNQVSPWTEASPAMVRVFFVPSEEKS